MREGKGKMLINIPEGKTLKTRAGGYSFVGPMVIDTRDKFPLEVTYTDGSPLEYVKNADSAKLADPPVESPTPAPNHPEGGSGRKRKNSKRVPGDNPLPESHGESLGVEVFLGELGNPADAGARRSESPALYPRIYEHSDETIEE